MRGAWSLAVLIVIGGMLALVAASRFAPQSMAIGFGDLHVYRGAVRVFALDAPTSEVLAANRAIEEALAKKLPPVRTEGVSFASFVAWLAEHLDTPVAVVWADLEQYGIGSDAEVDVSVGGMRAQDALEHVLSCVGWEAGLSWQIENRRLMIASTDYFRGRMVTRIYDVRGHLAALEAWRDQRAAREARRAALGAQPQPSAEATSGDCFGQSDPYAPDEELVEILVQTVYPDEWCCNGGMGRVYGFNGFLVVTTSRYVHRATEALLNALIEIGAVGYPESVFSPSVLRSTAR